MMFGAVVSSTLVSVGSSLVVALLATTTGPDQIVDADAASCFAIAGKIACVDAGYVPVVPIAPIVLGPMGPDVTGEDEDIVIRDNGGRQVARG